MQADENHSPLSPTTTLSTSSTTSTISSSTSDRTLYHNQNGQVLAHQLRHPPPYPHHLHDAMTSQQPAQAYDTTYQHMGQSTTWAPVVAPKSPVTSLSWVDHTDNTARYNTYNGGAHSQQEPNNNGPQQPQDPVTLNSILAVEAHAEEMLATLTQEEFQRIELAMQRVKRRKTSEDDLDPGWSIYESEQTRHTYTVTAAAPSAQQRPRLNSNASTSGRKSRRTSRIPPLIVQIPNAAVGPTVGPPIVPSNAMVPNPMNNPINGIMASNSMLPPTPPPMYPAPTYIEPASSSIAWHMGPQQHSAPPALSPNAVYGMPQAAPAMMPAIHPLSYPRYLDPNSTIDSVSSSSSPYYGSPNDLNPTDSTDPTSPTDPTGSLDSTTPNALVNQSPSDNSNLVPSPIHPLSPLSPPEPSVNVSAQPTPVRALPASPPVTTHRDGIEYVTFTYSVKGQNQCYTIRVDVESVSPLDGEPDPIPPEFKHANCLYPRAYCPPEAYQGNRWHYETECNSLGWRLAWLNADLLCGKRGLLQRAVDSFRNRYPNMRSRRVVRQEKLLIGTLRRRQSRDQQTIGSGQLSAGCDNNQQSSNASSDHLSSTDDLPPPPPPPLRRPSDTPTVSYTNHPLPPPSTRPHHHVATQAVSPSSVVASQPKYLFFDAYSLGSGITGAAARTERPVRLRIRVDLERAPDPETMDEAFKRANCVFPRAYRTSKDGKAWWGRKKEELSGSSEGEGGMPEGKLRREEKERVLNEVGWRLAWLNRPKLASRRILLQRAVDIYRMHFSSWHPRTRATSNPHGITLERRFSAPSSFAPTDRYADTPYYTRRRFSMVNEDMLPSRRFSIAEEAQRFSVLEEPSLHPQPVTQIQQEMVQIGYMQQESVYAQPQQQYVVHHQVVQQQQMGFPFPYAYGYDLQPRQQHEHEGYHRQYTPPQSRRGSRDNFGRSDQNEYPFSVCGNGNQQGFYTQQQEHDGVACCEGLEEGMIRTKGEIGCMTDAVFGEGVEGMTRLEVVAK
ncbi:hypothetical protein BC937DRAFT_92914 [Endogone sp. FLAS-F59071]|nr:hypothetical protein BC937DRAFT_92914 [Endogone sp. FLAS-F59071]|eukprot:RUS15089.1 hypothetical protein BC937DRAFT_92914 [Endogone sp. FLAS-F59071]